MRIPLIIEQFITERYFAFVPFFLEIDSFRVFRPAKALIDTGSPYTTISPRDALAFSLPLRNWQKGNVVSLAGYKFFRHTLENALLTFRDVDSKVCPIRLNIDVLVPTKMDSKSMDDIQHIPSIVGTDFLEDNGFQLVFDPKARTGFLTKEDETLKSTETSTTT